MHAYGKCLSLQVENRHDDIEIGLWSLPTSRHSGDSHRDSYSPCGIGRRSGLPWARLIPRVGVMTTTGPLGTALARQPMGGSQGLRQPSVIMPITRSKSVGADNAANLEEVETSITSGSGEVRELTSQLAALTDLVAQQAAAAHSSRRMQQAAAREAQVPAPPMPVEVVAPRVSSPALDTSRTALWWHLGRRTLRHH
uniref:Uncharacterized protein n=1 Tax=Ananas comosus var. bracteatus TaxID=296719 RepID=A0A6V7NST7_ANACO|nr:unnamed protein product [Ananas comosus var. bracteatus]